jgi:hypothetical protein
VLAAIFFTDTFVVRTKRCRRRRRRKKEQMMLLLFFYFSFISAALGISLYIGSLHWLNVVGVLRRALAG